MFKYVKALTVTLFAVFSFGLAHAAPLSPFGSYSETGTCGTGDISGGAIDCFGASKKGPGIAKIDANNDSFGGKQGLFGLTNWSEVYSGNKNIKSQKGQGLFLSSWDLKGPVAVMLQHGKNWSAYMFNGFSSGLYRFDLSGTTKSNVSSFRVLNTSPVPVPAALPMLGVALGGLFVMRRRKT